MSKAIEIKNDMKELMKAKDKERLTAVRMLISSLEKEKVKLKLETVEKLNDDVVVEVVQREIKSLDQELESLVTAGRNTDSVELQKTTLKKYLPTQLSEDEVKTIVEEKINLLEIKSKTQMGKLMGVLSKELKGKTDLGKVSVLVNSLLK